MPSLVLVRLSAVVFGCDSLSAYGGGEPFGSDGAATGSACRGCVGVCGVTIRGTTATDVRGEDSSRVCVAKRKLI